MAVAQLAIRFVLEVAALAAAAIVGASVGSPPLGLAGAIAFAAVLAVAWGLFLAPRSRFPQPALVRFAVGTGVMEIAAVGLAVVGPTTAGLLLAAAILANAVALLASGATDPDRVFSR